MDQRLKHNLSSPHLHTYPCHCLRIYLSLLCLPLWMISHPFLNVLPFPTKQKMSHASLSNTSWLQYSSPSLLNCIYANSTQMDPSFGTAWHSISNESIFPSTPSLIHHECSGRPEEATVRMKNVEYTLGFMKFSLPTHHLVFWKKKKKNHLFFGFISSSVKSTYGFDWEGVQKKLSYGFVTLLQRWAWCC